MMREVPFWDDYDVIVFTESGLHEDISNQELGLENFNVFRKDRSPLTITSERLGVVLIAVKKCYHSIELQTPNNMEEVFVKVSYNNTSLVIGSVYIVPSSKSSVYTNYIESVEELHEQHIGLPF